MVRLLHWRWSLPVDVGHTQLRSCHIAGRYRFLDRLNAVSNYRCVHNVVGLARTVGMQRLEIVTMHSRERNPQESTLAETM
jgi:hypothetical protein